MYRYFSCVHVCVWCPQMPEEDVGSSGLKLQKAVNHHIGAENRTWILWKTARALNYWAVCPVPVYSVFNVKHVVCILDWLRACSYLIVVYTGHRFFKPAFYPLEESESPLSLLRKDKNRIWVTEGQIRNASWRYSFLMESSQSNVQSPFCFSNILRGETL